MGEYKHKELTSEIIGAAHTVHNKLGYGFLEKIYHNSLFIELKKKSYRVKFEKPDYLKATGLDVGLIINFGPSVQVKRMVL